MIISEADQKLLAEHAAVSKELERKIFGDPNPTGAKILAGYRAAMLELNPFKFPKGFRSPSDVSFEAERPLRTGLTAAVAIPHGDGPFPVMMHAHGHGLRAGRPPEYEPWIREMAAYGFAVVFPDYRWQPEATYEDQIDDMLFSVAWAKQNAEALKADVDRMTIGGDSMAGVLALEVVTRELRKPAGHRFKALVAVDAMFDLPDNVFGSDAKGTNLLAALTAETPLPPIYLAFGSADYVAGADVLTAARRLFELGKQFQMDVTYGMPHDFMKMPLMEAGKAANRRMMEFLLNAV